MVNAYQASKLFFIWQVTAFARPTQSPLDSMMTALPYAEGADRLRILNELASALHYVHQQGIVFRDLKIPLQLLILTKPFD